MSSMSQAQSSIESLVNNFFRSYLAFIEKPTKGDYESALIAWIQKQPSLTDAYKREFKKVVMGARKKDPELGLDYDPILNAQDVPEHSLKATAVKVNGNTASALAVEKSGFKIKIGLVKIKGKWLINRIADISGK